MARASPHIQIVTYSNKPQLSDSLLIILSIPFKIQGALIEENNYSMVLAHAECYVTQVITRLGNICYGPLLWYRYVPKNGWYLHYVLFERP